MVYCTLEEAFSNPNITKEKINCNKHKTRFNNFDGLELVDNPKDSLETFENYNPGEMFEYSKENNRIIPEDSNIDDIINSVSDNDSLNTSKKNNKKKNTKKKIEKPNKTENNLNPQINEINTKINFLINQIENKDNSDNSSLDNNIHDIILFILFGIFVIIILEGLLKLVNKIYKHNLLNNLY